MPYIYIYISLRAQYKMLFVDIDIVHTQSHKRDALTLIQKSFIHFIVPMEDRILCESVLYEISIAKIE